MSPNKSTQILLAAAMKLPKSERILIAEELIATLDEESESEADEAWTEEIEKRIKEIESGKVKGIAWPQVKKAGRKQYGGKK